MFPLPVSVLVLTLLLTTQIALSRMTSFDLPLDEQQENMEFHEFESDRQFLGEHELDEDEVKKSKFFKSFKADVERKFREQQRKIDDLSVQTSELLNQLTNFYMQDKPDQEGTGLYSEQEPPKVLQISSTGGVTYVRWGRTECNANAILYRGFAAGSPYNVYGSGSSFLCLHSTPVFKTGSSAGGTITGVEYAMASTPFTTTNNGGQTLLRNDMPCSVCHIQTRSAQIMIPGRFDCPAGWFLEFWGFLMSSAPSSQKSTEYICVDNAPEAIPGGSATTISALLYPVQPTCGFALPCPPYVASYNVPCAVCTK